MRKIKNCIVVGRLLFGCSTNVLGFCFSFFVNIIVTDYLFCEKKATVTTVTYSFARRQSDHFCDMQHWFGGLLHLFQTLNSIWLLPYGILIIIFTCVCFYFFPFFFFYLLLYDSKKKITKPIRINQMENAVIFIHWKCAVCFIDENDQNIYFLLFNFVFYLMWLQWTVNDGEQTQFGVALYVLKIHTFSLVLFEQ